MSTCTLSTATRGRAVHRVGEEESADGNDDVDHHTETPLEIVGLAIAKEGADHEDSKNEGNGVEDGEVVVHVWNAETPANKDDKRSVEQCCLNGSAHDVGHGHVDLVIVGFVDSKEMLCEGC